jgi:ATP-dependent HslUV protease, peptidase subunit HslV
MSMHGTTILAVRHNGRVAVAGDGQVTLNNGVIKHHARKVRRIYNDRIIVGFAGATADALHLSERLEEKLERYNGNLVRAAVELARDWRTDKYLRRLEAMMIAVDETQMLLISGNGDVIEPDEGVIAIGSGGTAAQAAASALMRHAGVIDLSAKDIVTQAMDIAADICIYTNDKITVEEI